MAGLATLSTALVVVCAAMMTSWSLFKAANTGRRIRTHILEKTVGSFGGGAGDNTDITQFANELIVKIKVIENFQVFDEGCILINILIVACAFALSLVFAWFGGLVVVGCLVVSTVGSSIIINH